MPTNTKEVTLFLRPIVEAHFRDEIDNFKTMGIRKIDDAINQTPPAPSTIADHEAHVPKLEELQYIYLVLGTVKTLLEVRSAGWPILKDFIAKWKTSLVKQGMSEKTSEQIAQENGQAFMDSFMD